MTKRLYLLCLLASLAGAQTSTVTSVTYDSLSHSTIRIDFQTSAGFSQGHIRYIDTTANPGGVCTDGQSGVVQPTQYNPPATPPYGAYQMVIGGLMPSHTYSFCPEISNSTNGVYTTGGPFVSVTMPPIPVIHPALPTVPTTFSTGYPSDMASYPTLRMGTDCTNFVACMTTAINNQLSNGTIISIPAGVSAASIGGIGPFGGEGIYPVAPDVVNFSSSAVSTSANTITSTGHGFTEGSQAIFGVSYGCLPGDYTANPSNCKLAGNNNPIPFPRGVPLFVHVVNANAFQVYTCPGANNGTAASCPFSQGTLLTFADAGSGTMRYVKWPRALHYIIVRTSTPDSQYVPPGSMVQGPPDGSGVPTRPTQWVSKMGNLQVAPGAYPLISFGDQNTDPMTANIRVVGIHFSYTDTSEPSVSGDPTNGGSFFTTDLATQNITWDRCYFDSPGTPFRTGIVFSWNGVNNGFFGNYVTGMEAWNQTASGLSITGSGSTATITSGSTHFGAGTGTLASNATITVSGSQSAQNRLFLYFTMGGTLQLAVPPGISAAVSGITNYHIASLGSGSATAAVGTGTTVTFPGAATPADTHLHYVDPIVSSSASCGSTSSFLANVDTNTPPSFSANTSGEDLGVILTSNVAQYLCGERFYKNVVDTGTHTAAAWTMAGTQLARATYSNETASGWQTVMFSSPVQLSAGTQFQVSLHSNSGNSNTANFFQNTDYTNAGLTASGVYVASNGNGSYGDIWPMDYLGNVGVGILGFIDVSTSGTVADAANSSIGTTYSGGNTMIGGLGPGPWMMIGNFISAAGLPWHFDNSGLRWAMRGDYTLIRNYHYGPRYTFFGTPTSNGLDYTWRQPLEWKGGNRLRIYGDIFDGSLYEGGSKAMIALQSPGEVNCVTDADVMFNTFKHGPGTLGGGLEYGAAPMSCPPVRTRYADNISWDISSAYSVNNAGTGWLLSGQIGAEDVIIDHNTDIGRSGGHTTWWDQSEFRIEGVKVTNNFLEIDPQYGGLAEDASFFTTGGPGACINLTGENMANCKWTTFWIQNNTFLSVSGSTQQQIQSFYPVSTTPGAIVANNYIPSNLGSDQQGFTRAVSTYSLTTPDPYLKLLAPHVRGGSPAGSCADCGHPAQDSQDVGACISSLATNDRHDPRCADHQGVLENQGWVSAPNVQVSGTSVAISVVQPDSGTCSLDYGTEPTVTTFTRVTKSCAPGPVVFNISGLTAGTVYHFRYNGAVQQPMGQFLVP